MTFFYYGSVDIGKIGLRDLRMKVSIIPQDVSPSILTVVPDFLTTVDHPKPLIFSGTVRTALDPFGLYDDAQLWDALRRSSLVGAPGTELLGNQASLTLDTMIEPEGSNLSVGERSLLSLARALVKNSKVVILDEAT